MSNAPNAIALSLVLLDRPITDELGNARRTFKTPDYRMGFIPAWQAVEIQKEKFVRLVPWNLVLSSTPDVSNEYDEEVPAGHRPLIITGGGPQ
jgi:hypothetical protein